MLRYAGAMPHSIVVGAGAAGLAAARALHSAGRSFIVLEARERIGGRLWSIHAPPLPVAVELGGEFTHGETPEITGPARDAGLRVVDISGVIDAAADAGPRGSPVPPAATSSSNGRSGKTS